MVGLFFKNSDSLFSAATFSKFFLDNEKNDGLVSSSSCSLLDLIKSTSTDWFVSTNLISQKTYSNIFFSLFDIHANLKNVCEIAARIKNSKNGPNLLMILPCRLLSNVWPYFIFLAFNLSIFDGSSTTVENKKLKFIFRSP